MNETGNAVGPVIGQTLPDTIDHTGIALPDDLSFDGWLACAHFVRQSERGWQWWLGDLLVWAADHGLHNEAAQALDELGFDPRTLSNREWVARRFPRARRHAALSFTHHESVAGMLSDEDADMILERAEIEHWTRKELREALRLHLQTTGSEDHPAPRLHSGPQKKRFQYGPDGREIRAVDDVVDIGLLEACKTAQEALKAFEVVHTLGSGVRCVYEAAAVGKDHLLEVMELCERLGVEPI